MGNLGKGVFDSLVARPSEMGQVGFEPATGRLQITCSTTELLTPMRVQKPYTEHSQGIPWAPPSAAGAQWCLDNEIRVSAGVPVIHTHEKSPGDRVSGAAGKLNVFS